MSVVTNYSALLSGFSWNGGSPAQSVTLTYSFSTSATPFVQTTNLAAAQTFSPLTEAEKADVRRALGEWAAVSGISFHEVKATQGELTFGAYKLTSLGIAANVVGEGYYPITGTTRDASNVPHVLPGFNSVGGDVYFDTSYLANPAYSYDLPHIAVHEIGHALGLKHPFDTPGNTLAAPLDNGDETVMSYTGDRNGTLGRSTSPRSARSTALRLALVRSARRGTPQPSWSRWSAAPGPTSWSGPAATTSSTASAGMTRWPPAKATTRFTRAAPRSR